MEIALPYLLLHLTSFWHIKNIKAFGRFYKTPCKTTPASQAVFIAAVQGGHRVQIRSETFLQLVRWFPTFLSANREGNFTVVWIQLEYRKSLLNFFVFILHKSGTPRRPSTPRRNCSGKCLDGSSCRNAATKDSMFCWHHAEQHKWISTTSYLGWFFFSP